MKIPNPFSWDTCDGGVAFERSTDYLLFSELSAFLNIHVGANRNSAIQMIFMYDRKQMLSSRGRL